MKQDRLWLKWLNEYYLKGNELLYCREDAGQGWVWSYLMRVKEEMMKRCSNMDLQHWEEQGYDVRKGYRALFEPTIA